MPLAEAMALNVARAIGGECEETGQEGKKLGSLSNSWSLDRTMKEWPHNGCKGRVQDVIDLIARGCSNKEIASELNIAVHTVKSHVHNILEKLAIHSRLEVASIALTRPAKKASTPDD